MASYLSLRTGAAERSLDRPASGVGASGLLWDVGPFQRGKRPESPIHLDILPPQIYALCERWIVGEKLTDLGQIQTTQREQ